MNAKPGKARIRIRPAIAADAAAITELMERSIRELQAGFLNDRQIAASFDIMGLDQQLIEDGTYFVVEERGVLVGCGGWSRRATLYGSSHTAGRDEALLDPFQDAARIRAMYTHPAYARRGIGRLILETCETEARGEGFQRVELVATLSGEPLYSANGYQVIEGIEAPTRSGIAVPVRRMEKTLC